MTLTVEAVKVNVTLEDGYYSQEDAAVDALREIVEKAIDEADLPVGVRSVLVI